MIYQGGGSKELDAYDMIKIADHYPVSIGIDKDSSHPFSGTPFTTQFACVYSDGTLLNTNAGTFTSTTFFNANKTVNLFKGLNFLLNVNGKYVYMDISVLKNTGGLLFSFGDKYFWDDKISKLS